MASGIYRLIFLSGDSYVGKSVDVLRRWGQHFDKLDKGTAAAPVQDAFRRSGNQYPITEVLLDVHPDLLDEYEGYYIHLLNPSCNTSMPPKRTPREYELLEYYGDRNNAQYSFPDLVEYCKDLDVAKKTAESAVQECAAALASASARVEILESLADSQAYVQLRKTGVFTRTEASLLTARAELDQLRTELEELQRWKVSVKNLTWWQRLWAYWP